MQMDFYYELEGVRFFPRQRRLLHLTTNITHSLTPKQSNLLILLIRNQGVLVTYDEIRFEVWAGNSVEVDVDRNIKEVVHTLRKALGKAAAGKIETITGKGYRLTCKVISNQETEFAQDDRPPTNLSSGIEKESEKDKALQNNNQQITDIKAASGLYRMAGGHFWYLIVSCALYSLLYSIALVAEIAYRFDRFGATALKIAPMVFLWILTTSIAGSAIDWQWIQRERRSGIIASLLIFTGAGLILYVVLGLFLPSVSITEATFQTYTAHGAYLKDTCYFLFLAILFLILPFHFILSLQKEMRAGGCNQVSNFLEREKLSVAPRNVIYLRVWWLGLILLCIAIASPVLTAYLFDRLKPSVYMNLFMQLVIWRLLLYLVLGLQCLLWYYWSLNEIKRECVKPERSLMHPTSAV
jgi:DNA-binding winged helix-turn-helix (wHTH) protein